MDIVTAFLYNFLDEITYIEQLHVLADGTSKVCKLIKTMYNLKKGVGIIG